MSDLNIASTVGSELRVLSDDEVESVNGGFIWIAAVVGGFALGTGIRYAADALASWILD
jgi:hypothetical protein